MDYLHETGRSFRAERVPFVLYAQISRGLYRDSGKIVKEEERCIRFWIRKGFVHQLEFLHGKGKRP